MERDARAGRSNLKSAGYNRAHRRRRQTVTQQTTPPTGFCITPPAPLHDTGPTHPERPDRLAAIGRAVREAGLIDSPDPFPELTIDFGAIEPARQKLTELSPPATATLEQLALVH